MYTKKKPQWYKDDDGPSQSGYGGGEGNPWGANGRFHNRKRFERYDAEKAKEYNELIEFKQAIIKIEEDFLSRLPQEDPSLAIKNTILMNPTNTSEDKEIVEVDD